MDKQPHLLVVDDDREIRTLISQFLTKHGYRVSSAANGAEMMQVLNTSRIDLIVLDLMMPGEDGLSLCRRLRAQSGPSGAIPIIMLTAMGEETDRIVGLEMGADDYLPKPFNPRELLARAKAVLRRVHRPAGRDLGGAGGKPGHELRRLAARHRQAGALVAGQRPGSAQRRRIRPAGRLRRTPAAGPYPRSTARSGARTQRHAVRPQHRCPGQPPAPQDRAGPQRADA